MDMTSIVRMVSGALALVGVAVLVYRRKRAA
jgi:LPXTG-motif cell wall-anchored protein